MWWLSIELDMESDVLGLLCPSRLPTRPGPDYWRVYTGQSCILALYRCRLLNCICCSDHCIDILRQSLMCTADVGLITFDWVNEHRGPWPNFSILHRCRDYDKLVGWNRAHSVVVNSADNLTQTGVISGSDQSEARGGEHFHVL